tara:strand:- start:192 stop:539 length:348 start_codon:yes stop_codon:yes gene_type:complete
MNTLFRKTAPRFRSLFKKVASPLNTIFSKVANTMSYLQSPQVQRIINSPQADKIAKIGGAEKLLGNVRYGSTLLEPARKLSQAGAEIGNIKNWDALAKGDKNELERAKARVRGGN